ncbi:hypothetical protein LSTR_LSTR011687 [Laodelphax striatellus]|uniref:Uncharacterized protein n=1 Tax=Laodelphax striatellus TaxID=195883 RepID=A0A482WWG9_LAOST|nr:hypothetical protein LSTR_LSTR016843 [Laodelphax striatellus]RZF37410.1 hypothetical protein LSTR_LSTR011687 [Laodelphax striatellus]
MACRFPHTQQLLLGNRSPLTLCGVAVCSPIIVLQAMPAPLRPALPLSTGRRSLASVPGEISGHFKEESRTSNFSHYPSSLPRPLFISLAV